MRWLVCVPGQDMEPKITLWLFHQMSECMCKWLNIETLWATSDRNHCFAPEEQDGLCHQCINVHVNG